MKVVWLTDIHLNFLHKNERKKFYQQVIDVQCQSVLISGDIAEANCISDLLGGMVEQVKKPIYFVLGNHDYYRGNVKDVREEMSELNQSCPNLFWLPAAGVQSLNHNTVIVGEDGWADGRLGDYTSSRVLLNDSRMIADLFQAKIVGKFPLLEKMQQLADADASKLQENLYLAVKQHPKKIIVLTHVPPFKEACMHEDKMSDEDWLPFFGSKVMGDILMKVAIENASIEFLVFCGHTHSQARYQPLTNLTVETGKAEYYYPRIEIRNI